MLLVNVQGAGGASAVHWAAKNGRTGAIRVLLEVGAEAGASAADGSRPCISALQRHVRANVGALTLSGDTPLQLSIRYGHRHVERVLRELERSYKKEAAAKEDAANEAVARKNTQQAIEQVERMPALLIEEEEREEAAQRKVRDCYTLTLAELHGPRLDGVSIAHGSAS
jgi:hypothetical protein